MNRLKVGKQDKTQEHHLTIIRLTLLLIQIMVLLNNRTSQTENILTALPYLLSAQPAQLQQIENAFSAANTMALVFAVMQLLVLYVGTTRFRVAPTIFSAVMYIIGTYFYYSHSQLQYQHIWLLFHLFSFTPLCSEIAISLYTAKQ